jgi:hypothetical protein
LTTTHNNMATVAQEPTNIDFALTTGTLKKPIYEMTTEEREEFYKGMALETRTYLFSIGQRLVYEKNGKIVAEYADGTIKLVR